MGFKEESETENIAEIRDGDNSLSLSISKDSITEEMFLQAASDVPVKTDPDTISNEQITKGTLVLETYRVESEAIKGGMGSVWKVHHKDWDTDLAMKRPQPKFFAEAGKERKENFIHECETWINLGLHPNIVSCYYVREIGGIPTIFSEWMENGSLKNRIDDGSLYEGTQEEVRERLLDIAIQFARGLYYAHESEGHLIHQDVKPDNLLLTEDWEAKVADFGLAKARAQLFVPENEKAPLDEGATIMAPTGGYTPAYCSMEQESGKPLTRRSDIYSWALSVMEMYIGHRPWRNGAEAGLHGREYLADTKVPVPEALKVLLSDCMKTDPESRPHDFAVVGTRLHEIYRAETGSRYSRPEPEAAADTADSLNNKALSYLDLGRVEDAERVWEQAYDIKEDDDAINVNRTLLSWRRGRIDDIQMRSVLAHALEDASFDEALTRECGSVSEMNKLLISKGVPRVAVSGDGRFAVISAYHMAPKVISLPSLEILYTLDVADMACTGLTFSLDGDRIYAECQDGARTGYRFFIFDTVSGKRLQEKKYTGTDQSFINHMRVTPDGTKIVCLSTFSNTFVIRDAQTGELISEHHMQNMMDRHTQGFVLLPCGTQAILMGYINAYRIDLESWETMNTYIVEETENPDKSEYHGYLKALAADPSGELFLTGDEDGRIIRWDVESGKRLKTLYQCNTPVRALCFCGGGQRFVSADTDGVLRFHDYPDGGHVVGHIVSAEGIIHNWLLGVTLLPLAEPDTMLLVDDKSNFLLVRFTAIGDAAPMRLSRIASFKQTVTDEEEYRAAIASAKEALGKRQYGAALAAVEDAYSCTFRDAEELAELNRSIGRFCQREKLRSANVVKTLNLSDQYQNEYETPIDVRVPWGSSYAYATGSHSNSGIYEINLKTLEAEEYCKEHSRDRNRNVQGTQISPNGSYMTVISSRIVELYELKQSKKAFRGRISNYTPEVFAACCDNDGNVLFYGLKGADFRSRKSKYRKGLRLETKNRSIKYENCACISPDGRRAYLMTPGYLLQFRLDRPEEAKQLILGHFNSLTLSHDGSLIAVGGNYGLRNCGDVYVLRSDDARVIFQRDIDGAGVNALAFGPDGRTLFCALSDGTVSIYDLTGSEPVQQLSRGQYKNFARSVAVTSDARYVLVGEQMGDLCIWELDWKYNAGKPGKVGM